MTCSQCGADVTGRDYCPLCGAKVVANGTAPVDAPEVPDFYRAIEICLREKYLSFKGRASQQEFWYFLLGAAIMSAVVSLILSPINLGPFSAILDRACYLFFLLPLISVSVRRLHDVGLPGWVVLAVYLGAGALTKTASWIGNPIVMKLARWAVLLTAIGFFGWPGTCGPNKYGPAPRKRP